MENKDLSFEGLDGDDMFGGELAFDASDVCGDMDCYWDEETESLQYIQTEGGLNLYGFDVYGINARTNEKYDINGFDERGIHHVTKTKYSPEGFDRDGYNIHGWYVSASDLKESVMYKADLQLYAHLKHPSVDDCVKYETMSPLDVEYLNFKYRYDWFDKQFEENGRKGLKDAKGKVLIPPMYEGFSEFYDYKWWRSYPVPAMNSEGKFALVKTDGSGAPITEFVYDSIAIEPSCGFYLVSKNGCKGLVLKTGEVLLPCKFDDFTLNDTDVIDISLAGKHGLLKFNGLYIEPVFDKIDCKIGRINTNRPLILVYVQFEGKNGFLDKLGNFIEEKECKDVDILLCYDDTDGCEDCYWDEETGKVKNRKTEEDLGFDEKGIHRITQTEYNPEGYNCYGYDSYRRDQEGYNQDGDDKCGFNREGLCSWGNYRARYNRKGSDKDGLSRADKIYFDIDGYDVWGFDKDGFDKEGYDYRGFDKDGNDRNTQCKYNASGFGENGYHKETNTLFNPEGYNFNGYDIEGYDKEGFNEFGFNRKGIHKKTLTGYNELGFDMYGVHKITGTLYNEGGFTIRGFDKDGNYRNGFYGYDEFGYDEFGYDREGYTFMGIDCWGEDKEYYDLLGYDSDARYRDGYDRNGYNDQGYDREGYNECGFDKRGIHKVTQREFNTFGFMKDKNHILTHTKYDEDGYDFFGQNAKGCDRFGYKCNYNNLWFYPQNLGRDSEGYDKDGYDEEGFDREGYSCLGFDKKGIHKVTQTRCNENGFLWGGLHIVTKGIYDLNGYNIHGYDRYGYDAEGYDKRGFDRNGIHKKTKTRYDEMGFDRYKVHFYTRTRYNEEGYDCDGYSDVGPTKTTDLFLEYIRTGNYEKLGVDLIVPVSFNWQEYSDDSKQESKNVIPEQFFDDERFQDAFKISEVNEEGYSESIPAIWGDYGFGRREDGVLILNLKSARTMSGLYSRYLDVKAIVYDGANNRLLIYEPDVSCPKMAFKGGAWEKAVVLKPEYESETTLEECYFELMSKLGYTSSYEMI